MARGTIDPTGLIVDHPWPCAAQTHAGGLCSRPGIHVSPVDNKRRCKQHHDIHVRARAGGPPNLWGDRRGVWDPAAEEPKR